MKGPSLKYQFTERSWFIAPFLQTVTVHDTVTRIMVHDVKSMKTSDSLHRFNENPLTQNLLSDYLIKQYVDYILFQKSL